MDYFPKIFGDNHDQSLDYDAAFAAMSAVADQINAAQGTAKSVEEVALGFVAVANEAMCRPIRALTQAKVFFYNPSEGLHLQPPSPRPLPPYL